MKNLQMHLERDEFEITYDASKVSVEQLIAAAKQAGYTSQVVAASGNAPPTLPSSNAVPKGVEVLDKALDRAKKERKPVVIVFSAEWCVPCKKFDRETLADDRVVRLLDRCVLLKIDADKEADLAKQFQVVGLPDIRFLNVEGKAVKRLEERLDSELFAAELEALLKSAK